MLAEACCDRIEAMCAAFGAAAISPVRGQGEPVPDMIVNKADGTAPVVAG